MKKVLIIITVFLAACNSSKKSTSEQQTEKPTMATVNPQVYAATITENDLKDHLYTYASDEFEGRETGKPGQKKAVEFLREQYEKMGIPAAQKNGDYFQHVPLEYTALPEGSLKVNGKQYDNGDHLLTFDTATATYPEIVYVGYGIEDTGYSDYKNLDVTGKLVLLKAGEPVDANGNYSISSSKEKSFWSNISEALPKKMEIAKSKGAVGMLYFDPDNYSRFKRRFDYMKTNNSGRMELKTPESNAFYSLYIDEDLATTLYADIRTNDEPKQITLDVSVGFESSSDAVNSENVVAFIKGSEKPEEYLIISSHLDHIGISANGDINNGADDDGSGTVAVLAIAKAFKKAVDDGHGPKRSVVFLHVTGEEKGLFGSQYYTDFDPVFPLEKTVADLNIDMIGRIDPKRDGNRNYVYLIGSDKLSTELHNLSEEINDKYSHIELDYTYNDENDPNRFYYRSDHYNFAKNNIPIIFYFNGTHDDYHQPSDTPDKINYDLLENRTRLVFYTAWEIVNREQRLKVDKAIE